MDGYPSDKVKGGQDTDQTEDKDRYQLSQFTQGKLPGVNIILKGHLD